MFAAGTYAERRARLAASVQSGMLLFLGNGESPMNYTDNTYPFRQDSTWLYYFGDRPARAGRGRRRRRAAGRWSSATISRWTPSCGPGPSRRSRNWRRRPASLRARRPARSQTCSARRGAAAGPIHYLPPYRDEHRVALAGLLGVPVIQADAGASLDFIRAVVEMRITRAPRRWRRSSAPWTRRWTCTSRPWPWRAPACARATSRRRVTEIALAAGGGLSFPVIATIHGETLHNHYHGNTLAPGDLFLLDCGAETAMHYAGDLSSTFPVDTTFDSRQKDVYQIVLDAHLAAVAAVKPGRPFREIHLLACRTIAEGLKGLGLMKGDLDEAVAQGAHAMFFQCGLGHMMGLDVHDMENLGEVWVGYAGQPKSTQFGLKSLRLARPLEPGFVITVEPGIYFIPELIRRWKAERTIPGLHLLRPAGGVRGLRRRAHRGEPARHADGHRILGKPRPRTIDEVEAIRRG